MNRHEKHDWVCHFRSKLETSALVVVTQPSGLTVLESTKLRRLARQEGAEFKVAKNTLLSLAIKGTRFEGLTSLLKGPTALAFSKDPIAAAKVCVKFAEENAKLSLRGGYLDGQILSLSSLKSLASLPSLDELRAKIVAIIQTPARRLAVVTQEPASQLARIFCAKSKVA